MINLKLKYLILLLSIQFSFANDNFLRGSGNGITIIPGGECSGSLERLLFAIDRPLDKPLSPPLSADLQKSLDQSLVNDPKIQFTKNVIDKVIDPNQEPKIAIRNWMITLNSQSPNPQSFTSLTLSQRLRYLQEMNNNLRLLEPSRNLKDASGKTLSITQEQYDRFRGAIKSYTNELKSYLNLKLEKEKKWWDIQKRNSEVIQNAYNSFVNYPAYRENGIQYSDGHVLKLPESPEIFNQIRNKPYGANLSSEEEKALTDFISQDVENSRTEMNRLADEMGELYTRSP